MSRSSLLRRGLLAGAVVAAGGGGVLALGVTPAGAAPSLSTIAGHNGTAALPTLGNPQTTAGAKISPSYIAYNTNGDEAVVANTRVFLITAAVEPNVYHIATGTSSGTPVYGSTLLAHEVYLVAGNGTNGMVSKPGTATTHTYGSPSPTAAQDPVAPFSVAFDHNGNILIGEQVLTEIKAGVQVVAKANCSSACGYRLSSMTAGHLYTAAASGLAITTTSIVPLNTDIHANGLVVDGTTQGNLIATSPHLGVYFINLQTTPITRWGSTIPSFTYRLIAGHLNGTGSCTAATAPATTTAAPTIANRSHLFMDSSDNIYVTDTQTTAHHGCLWVLPAATGTLDGKSVTVGRMYPLTAGNTATPGNGTGTAAATHKFPLGAVAVDAAGNVVFGTNTTTPGIYVLAEHTGTYWGTPMTKGDDYKLSLTPALAGVTSLTTGAAGSLLLTDGPAAGTLTAYTLTGGPMSAPGKTTPTVTLSENPASGTAVANQAITLTATVSAGAPGTVTFYVTGVAQTPVKPVSGGVAHFAISGGLAAGTHHLKAAFVTSTTATFNNATSATVTYKVVAATTAATANPVDQQVSQSLKGGHLTLSCTQYEASTYTVTGKAEQYRVCNLVTLPAVKITGLQQTSTATMDNLYINTARGTPTSGWSLSAVMEPSTTIPTTTHNGNHNDNTNASCDGVVGFCDSSVGTNALKPQGQIPASDFSLTGFACTPAATNSNPTPAPAAGGALASSELLCTAVAGTSGGEYLVHNGTYSLTIPAKQYKGVYYGTVQFTIVATA